MPSMHTALQVIAIFKSDDPAPVCVLMHSADHDTGLFNRRRRRGTIGLQWCHKVVYNACLEIKPSITPSPATRYIFLPDTMHDPQPSRFQSSRPHKALLAKFLVVLMMLFHSWGSYANISSSSHDPANWSGHNSALFETGTEDHEHSHDHPDSQDRSAGHQHVHNAADHSHDKSNLPRNVVLASVPPKDGWGTALPVPIHPAPYFVFERPPKHLPIN